MSDIDLVYYVKDVTLSSYDCKTNDNVFIQVEIESLPADMFMFNYICGHYTYGVTNIVQFPLKGV